MKYIIRLSIILIAVLLFKSPLAAENITGTWQGKLVVSPETELKIQFIISKGDDGSYAAVLDSPDQGAIKDIEASSVVYDAGNLKVDVADLSGAYEGVVKEGKMEGNWIQEGTSMPLNLVPYVKPTLSREDKEKLLGSWHGPIEFPGRTITAVYRFEMNEEGEFVGFAESPDQGAFNTPITDMEMEDGTLTIRVAAWQVEYKGKMAGDKIVGEFNQRGNTSPLTLQKGEYKVKGISLNVSEEDREKLSGPWHGEWEAPQGTRTAIVRFETTEDGEFVGFVDSPDPGTVIELVSYINIEGDTISIKSDSLGLEFHGKITGDKISGESKISGALYPITLKRGEYVAPVYSLDLPKEVMDRLSGTWRGKLGPMTLVFRFEKTEKGEFVGFIDQPDQGARGIAITEAAFSDGKLILKEKRANAEYVAQLSDNSLAGEWKQRGQSYPLTLTKE